MLTTPAKDLRFLGAQPNLRYLSLSAPLTSLAGLERFPNLGELIVHDAKLTRLKRVAHSKIWKLIIPNSQLTTIPQLDLPALTSLLLYKNRITEISGLGNVPKLAYLALHGNKIPVLDGLEKLTALEKLLFDGRFVKAISRATDAALRARTRLELRAGSRATPYAQFAATKTII